MVLTAPFISIAGTDLSAFAMEVTPTPNVNMVECTVGNTGGVSTSEPGMEAFQIKAKFKHTSMAAGQPHTVLYAQHRQTNVAVVFRASQAVVGPTNPQLTFTGTLSYDQHPGGAVGSGLTVGCTIYCNQSGYTWATA